MRLLDASQKIMALKGAALSCLLLMWLMRKSRQTWNVKQLATLTGWSRESVSTGLNRLQLAALVARMDYESWQLTDKGKELDFEPASQGQNGSSPDGNANYLKAKIFDSRSSSFKESNMYLNDSLTHEQLQLKVENFDFGIIRDSIFERLTNHLISCGCSPEIAQNAILAALPKAHNWREIEIRILYWRGYVATQKSIGHAGNLIAKRISQGLGPPVDFSLADFPDKLFDLKQEIEDLEQELDHVLEQRHSE